MNPNLATSIKNQTDLEVAKKIYPTAEELCKITNVLHCPEENCNSLFASESNLNLHIIKKHKKKSLQKNEHEREFYCPDSECVYNEVKFFKTMKLLKQHFLKVHSKKSYLCEICHKGFSTCAAKKTHLDYCGVNFNCCDCDSTYASYETLMTHARRKKHNILEKVTYKSIQNDEHLKSSSAEQLRNVEVSLPHSSASFPMLNYVLVKVNTEEKSSQTDICKEVPLLHSKVTQVNEFPLKESSSTHTQTHNNSIHTQTREVELAEVSSTETQTMGDYIVRKIKRSCSLNIDDEKKHNTTQTKRVSSDTKSCNTYFQEELDVNEDIAKNTLGTQTFTLPVTTNEVISSISTATHDSIHTDTSDLNFEFMDSSSQTNLADEMNLFDSSFFNCNIETQTDFMLDNDLLNYTDSDSTINSQTQTNVSNIFLNINAYNDPSKECDVLFSNIHTQTMFDDMSRSVESQTMLFAPKTTFMSCRDYANMETQTDIDFRNMLEQINA